MSPELLYRTHENEPLPQVSEPSGESNEHLFEVLADELGTMTGRLERAVIDKFAAFEREANLKIAVALADLERKLRDEINELKIQVGVLRALRGGDAG